MSTATVPPPQSVLPAPPPPPAVIHNCPSCAHWLPDGTLACPDCHALTYGRHLGALAAEAQSFEAQRRFAEARVHWQTALEFLPADTRQAEGIRQRIGVIDSRFAAEADRKARWTKKLGPFAPVALFLLKAKSFVFVLFKLKFLFSLLAYFGLYWAVFGWRFALGLTATIFIHELGHYIAIKRRGLKADLPVFLPGFGAYVRWYAEGVSREDLASIALAGPLFGLLAALGCWGLYAQTHYGLFLILANLTSWYNVVNLFPVFGLDGAKAILALSRIQRGMLAITSMVFFALTSARNPLELGNVSNHYVFVVLAAILGFQCLAKEAPEEPHTATLVYFIGVVLLLGLVLHITGLQASQLSELTRMGFRTH